MHQIINKLQNALKQGLPGEPAHLRMAPTRRVVLVPEQVLYRKDLRRSAVMILLCTDSDGVVYIPLIERHSYEGAHSGQISLPGGKYDEEDPSLEHTAIRECFEEIGVGDITVLGELTEISIVVSGFRVQPFIGVCNAGEAGMQLAEREVKSLIKFKLEDLLDENTVEMGSIEVPGRYKVNTAWYRVEGHKVWGATAMILSELKEVMRTIS